MRRELDRFFKVKIPPWRYGTVISLRDDATNGTLKDTEVRISREIVWQPADGVRFKVPLSCKFPFSGPG